ncbi:MAG: QueT transporter family protein [Clostridiales bacterium]|nr:QueT transporter family protein [Clostridiales bacterium]
MKRSKVQFLTQAAMIAAIYVVLTYLFQPFGFMDVQVRVAEALTILPFFTPAAIPGLFVGCLLGNLLGGAVLLDIVIGSLTTLVAACLSYLLRKNKYLVALPPIIANAIVVPWVLKIGYSLAAPIPLMMLTVGIGEIISCGILGTMLLLALNKYKNVIFRQKVA